MVQVRVVGMPVQQWLVGVPMAVRFSARVVRLVVVPMVRVMSADRILPRSAE
jgi:hypothetical protein